MKRRNDFSLELLFLVSFLIGGGVFALTSCRMMEGASKDLKEAGHWLPDPYGAVATSAGTVIAMFLGKKAHRHYRKRRDARKAAVR